MSVGKGAMEYRKLGKTGLQVSLLGYGAAPLGDVYGKTEPAEYTRAVHLAIEKGVNFFDNSPYYGITLAEERLGQTLVGKRDKILLATKCGRYGVSEFDFSAKRITASVDESLRRLQTDYVDLLQAHDVEFGDVQQVIDEALPAMRKIQEQGKARFIGITGYPLKTLRRIAEAVPVDTILSYCHYNLMNTEMDDVLTPFAKQHDIGLINASCLHMGVLTEQGAPAWHPAPPEVHAAAKKAAAICRAHGHDISEVALRFSFDHPYVSSHLVGMSTVHEVEANLKILQLRTDAALLQEVRAAIAPVFNFHWPTGRPENND
ncbi:MAG: aldo/keto reductase [Candidatus Acidiferrum sp.]